jgi:hypothetical protein
MDDCRKIGTVLLKSFRDRMSGLVFVEVTRVVGISIL